MKSQYALRVMLAGSHSRPQLLLLWVFAACVVASTQDCPLGVSIKPAPPDQNIFSEQQEADLGEIMAEAGARYFAVITDDTINAHLRAVGEEITRHLPPNQFRFRFFLIEWPEANAFSFSGGRIYVSRKLVSLAQSDDELAGVLAHEMGHVVTHQVAVRVTRRFRTVLGVMQVGDKADIAAKYHRLMDAWRLKADAGPSNEAEAEQHLADQIAIYAATRAGFAPEAGADLLDRAQQTRGKTGSWLSDFFGVTKPEQRRLREVLKMMQALPPACVAVSTAKNPEGFRKWQAEVVAYNLDFGPDTLSGVLRKQSLPQPMRAEITNLRFSPDGKYVLAQDSGGIHVLSREPFAVLFFIEAPRAHEATFSPDSKSIAFYGSLLRVESWGIANQERTVHEITVLDPCLQTMLSSDGNYLACLDTNFDLSVLEVASGKAVVSKKHFYEGYYYGFLERYLSDSHLENSAKLIAMGFSPDSRYFLAGTARNHLAFDLQEKHPVSVPVSIRNAIRSSFAFVGPDRLLGFDPYSPKKSPVVRFPSGEKLDEVVLSTTVIPGAHDDSVRLGNDYLYFFPTPRKRSTTILLLGKPLRRITLKRAAGDFFQGMVLQEEDNGDLSILELATNFQIARTQLQPSPLGTVSGVAVSDDFGRIAFSAGPRGAIWDLKRNVKTKAMHGFDGAWFGPDSLLYADFPADGKQARTIFSLGESGPPTPVSQVLQTVWEEVSQFGQYLVWRRPQNNTQAWFPGEWRKDWVFEVRDIRSHDTVWSKHFAHEIPDTTWDPAQGRVLLHWPASTASAKDELKLFPDLKQKPGKYDHLLEVVDFRRNSVIGKLIVRTNKGSFSIGGGVADGDWVVLELSDNRVVTYSLTSGEERGHVFGTSPVVSAASGLFAVFTNLSEVNVYRLNDTQLQRHFKFPSGVLYETFSTDGKRLFVLTGDQTAYLLDVQPSPPN